MNGKFRIWNESLRKWVYGQVCFMRADGDGFFLQDGKLAGMAPHYKRVFSTGLHDKNGKEIWEGDIANINRYAIEPDYGDKCTYTERGVMKWNEKKAQFAFYVRDSLFDEGEEKLEVEVLGNIYENPKLLEKFQ